MGTFVMHASLWQRVPEYINSFICKDTLHTAAFTCAIGRCQFLMSRSEMMKIWWCGNRWVSKQLSPPILLYIYQVQIISLLSGFCFPSRAKAQRPSWMCAGHTEQGYILTIIQYSAYHGQTNSERDAQFLGAEGDL